MLLIYCNIAPIYFLNNFTSEEEWRYIDILVCTKRLSNIVPKRMRKVIVRTVNATNSFWLCKALRTPGEGAPEMSLFKFSSCKRTCKMLQFNLLLPLCYVHWKATKNGKYKKRSTNFLFHLKNYPIWGFIVHTRSKTLLHNHFTGSNLFRGQKIRPLCIL